MTRKGRRLALIGSALSIAAVATGLVLYALRDSVVFFYSPAEVADKNLGPGTRLRLGGLVEQGSVERLPNNTVVFKVTDLAQAMTVTYTGLLPDLFREGQGVVAEGRSTAQAPCAPKPCWPSTMSATCHAMSRTS